MTCAVPMIHQWWCGGKDPCACTDGWKEEQATREHCWHGVNTTRTEIGHARWVQHNEQCCYCGEYRVREEQWQTVDDETHGRYAPRLWRRVSD